jgi:hypothetical protein
MKKKILAMAVLATTISSSALADLANGTPLITFNPPTTFDDGAALDPATDLLGYPLYCNGGTTPVLTIPATDTSYQASLGEFAVGTYNCQMTAIAVGGAESIPTPLVGFTVQAPPAVLPNPVTLPTVQ